MTWDDACAVFADTKTQESAKGWDGLDETWLVCVSADETADDIAEWIYEAIGSRHDWVASALGLIWDALESMLCGQLTAVIGVHFMRAGRADAGLAIGVVTPAASPVRSQISGDDHVLNWDKVLHVGSTDATENLSHKVGYALGFWPSRERY